MTDEERDANRYGAELDRAAAILSERTYIREIKYLGRMEVVPMLEELFPADDTLPVDEAWLRSVGFASTKREPKTLGLGGVAVHFFGPDTPGMWTLHGVACYGWQTRGEIRRLAAALGILLAEATR